MHNSEFETGRRQYISNVQVRDEFGQATSTLTNASGQFRLIFVGIQEKATVNLTFSKKNLEVVNIDALSAIAGQNDQVRISMAPPEKIAAYRAALYKIGKDQAELRLENKIQKLNTELISLRKNSVDNTTTIKTLTQNLKKLEDQRAIIDEQAQDFARRYAAINLDDASPIFQKAFSFFQKGDIDSALAVVSQINLAKAVGELSGEKGKILLLSKEINTRDSIQQQRTSEMLELLALRADLFETKLELDSAVSCYELMINLDSSFSTIYDYGFFLAQNDLYDKAEIRYLQALKLEQHVSPTSKRHEQRLARVYSSLGFLYESWSRQSDAQESYSIAIQIQEHLAATDSFKNERRLATYYERLGRSYLKSKNFDKAESAYLSALSIYIKDVAFDTATCLSDATDVLTAFGDLYKLWGKVELAERFYYQALSTAKLISRIEPTLYGDSVPAIQAIIGRFFQRTKRYDRASGVLDSALTKYRTLYSENPSGYGNELTSVLCNLGFVLDKLDSSVRAVTLYLEALKTYDMLVLTDISYESDIAYTYEKLGWSYEKQHNYKYAKDAYTKALGFYREIKKRGSNDSDDDIRDICTYIEDIDKLINK